MYHLDELPMSRSQNRHSTAPQHRSTAPLTASAKTLWYYLQSYHIYESATRSVLERQVMTPSTLSSIIIVATAPPYLHLHQGSNNIAMPPTANIAEHIMLASFSKKPVRESQAAYVNHRRTRHYQEPSVSKGSPKLVHENATLGINCMQCGDPLTKLEICSNLAQ